MNGQKRVLAVYMVGCFLWIGCGDDDGSKDNKGQDGSTTKQDGATGSFTEKEFCDKALLCDPSGTLDECKAIYAATNATCHQCISTGNCGDINAGSCNSACVGGTPDTCPGVPVNLINCEYNTDCGSGNHCKGGKCYDGAWNQPCTYDLDCDSVCTDGCCQ